MTISQLTEKMIAFSNGNLHDVNHFMKVWGFARTIGALEGLDPETLFILEAAAVVHDIACPLCRVKYGNTQGKHQEEESPALLEAFFQDTDLTERQKSRIVFLVSHHHTCTGVDGMDWQILLEADYLVNAHESAYSAENILNTRRALFRTGSGLRLLDSLYPSEKRPS